MSRFHPSRLAAKLDLRIGVDARPLNQPSTGIGRYTAEILRRITTIAPHSFYLYSHTHLPCAWQTETTHIRTGKVQLPRLGSLFAQTIFPYWINQDELDVFWSPRHHLPLCTRVPTVVTIHDLTWRRAPESMASFGRLIENLLMPLSIRKAEAIIAVSNATATDLYDYAPGTSSRTTIIKEAPFVSPDVSPANSTDQHPKTTPFILFVGTLEPRKNILGLLHAYHRLRSCGITSHKLVLAGSPGWKFDAIEAVRGLGLNEHVTLLQPDDAELSDLYGTCHYLVMPSFFEGFGLPIVEAFSFGKPVITSNVSSMPEVAGDAALLIDPNSVEEIANAMRRLITDRVLYDKLASKTKPQAAKFSWDKAAEQTLKIIEEVGSSGIRG